MKSWHWLLIVLGSALVLGGGYLVWQQSEKHKPTLVEESAEERERAIRDAFGPSSAGASTSDASSDPELARAADSFFKDLGVAFERSDVEKLKELISTDAMLSLLDDSKLIEFSSPVEKRNFRSGFERGFATGLAKMSQLMAFDDFKVLRLEKIKDGEMIAYARFWDDALEVYTKMRWWLIEGRDGKWAAYDYEDFDMNLRTSTLLGTLLSANLGAKRPWLDAFVAVVMKFQNLNSTGMVQALPDMEGEIDALLKHQLPRELEPFARILKSSILMMNEDYQGGLDQMDLVEKVEAGLPIVDYQRGTGHLGLENWDEAIVHYTKYGDVLGWDSDVHEMIADAYVGKEDFAKATHHAEQGLADNKNAWGCLMTFAVAAPEERWGDIEAKVEAAADPEGAYESVIDYAIEMEKPELARAVFAFLKEQYPQSELIEFYEEEFAQPEGGEASSE